MAVRSSQYRNDQYYPEFQLPLRVKPYEPYVYPVENYGIGDAGWTDEIGAPWQPIYPEMPRLDSPALVSENQNQAACPLGPVMSKVDLVRRPRRGGRQANPNRIEKRRIVPGPMADPKLQRQNTTIARKLKACSRCARLHIQCHVDPDDYLGPCLTCLWSNQPCPRFETVNVEAVADILHLMPHNHDTLRLHIESQSDSGTVRSAFLRATHMFPDLSLVLQAGQIAQMNSWRNYDTASTIAFVHQTSDDFTWNAFRNAFKLGFNPKWAHQARALRYALLIWAADMHFAIESVKLCSGSTDRILSYLESIGALEAVKYSATIHGIGIDAMKYVFEHDKGKGLHDILKDTLDGPVTQFLEFRTPYVHLVIEELIRLITLEDRLSKLVFHLTLFILRRGYQSHVTAWQLASLESYKHLFPVSENTGYPCI